MPDERPELERPENEPAVDEREPLPGPPRRWLPRSRLGLFLALLVPCAVIAVDIFFMLRASREGGPLVGQGGLAAQHSAAPQKPESERTPSLAVPAAKGAPMAVFDEEADKAERAKPEPRKRFASVHEASLGSCSTESVDGLSRQIIEQTRCIKPNAFVPLPTRPNLVLDDAVLPYLEASAREQLVKALDARRGSTMTINSALRTVAQQYLVWRWSAGKRCGVQLATPPGASNHETGLALDIAEASEWRAALEARDFRWLGASDKVHFDYKGSRAVAQNTLSVRAFQQLWNRNHPKDSIAESGRYDAATEQRLKKSPPDGFPLGARCAKPRTRGKR
jgi:hypothetical protein